MKAVFHKRVLLFKSEDQETGYYVAACTGRDHYCMSDLWQNVTCKNCLKKMKAAIDAARKEVEK